MPDSKTRPDLDLSPPRRLRLTAALRRFVATEASGGVVLLIAAVVAVAWANSAWGHGYESLWHTELELRFGDVVRSEDLRHLVNDALMALFFLVVGLEIKRELVTGELADRRNALLPAMAAVGGMVVPAALYAALNAGEPGSAGWGIPMATDIAFAMGVVAVLGRRIPSALRLFLLTLAIVDDIGAILVIAVFYTASVAWPALLAAAALLGLVVLARVLKIGFFPLYVVLGGAVWVAFYESGVHATLAGVVLGLLTPARSASKLEHSLHPVTSFVVVPIFALANAGVAVSADAFDAPGAGAVAIGVGVGLVVGKIVGITGFTWLAVRFGWASLPSGSSWRHLVGVAAVAGIGFTVSLFIAGLAFDEPALDAAAKIGILIASVVAAALGVALLATARRQPA